MGDTIVKLKVVGTIPGFALGQVVNVPADSEGTPLDFNWRRRLKGASVQVVVPEVEKPKPKQSRSRQRRAAVQEREA